MKRTEVLAACLIVLLIFFFNDTATTEIYTLSLHDALPISLCGSRPGVRTVRSSQQSERSASAP